MHMKIGAYTLAMLGVGVVLVGGSGIFSIPTFSIAGFDLKSLLLLAGGIGAFVLAFKHKD